MIGLNFFGFLSSLAANKHSRYARFGSRIHQRPSETGQGIIEKLHLNQTHMILQPTLILISPQTFFFLFLADT